MSVVLECKSVNLIADYWRGYLFGDSSVNLELRGSSRLRGLGDTVLAEWKSHSSTQRIGFIRETVASRDAKERQLLMN